LGGGGGKLVSSCFAKPFSSSLLNYIISCLLRPCNTIAKVTVLVAEKVLLVMFLSKSMETATPIIYSIIIIQPEFGEALYVQACFVLTLSIALTLVMDMRDPYS
jgi:hypothetical protein